MRLTVKIGELIVGQLSLKGDTALFSFDYNPNWIQQGYPLSPSLPFIQNDPSAIHSALVASFFQNLLPEGDQLEDVAKSLKLSKSNLLGLMRAIGRECAGAVSLTDGSVACAIGTLTEISNHDLQKKIEDREQSPFGAWNGKMMLSIAGFQDKLAVNICDGKMYLADGAASSTHIIKPIPRRPQLACIVANEHFCMTLASKIGLPVADVNILRVPSPCLVVKRFDRLIDDNGNVSRLHVIDACQALGMPPSYKYERNFGGGKDVMHIREGVSMAKIFSLTRYASNEIAFQRDALRWFMFQYFIGNGDAHGKNLSFFVANGGLTVAPSYDLVSTSVVDGLDDEMAMGISDSFGAEDAGAFQWADWSVECGLNRKLVGTEMMRMALAIEKQIPLVDLTDYAREEIIEIKMIISLIARQVERMKSISKMIPRVSDSDLGIEPSYPRGVRGISGDMLIAALQAENANHPLASREAVDVAVEKEAVRFNTVEITETQITKV